MRLGIKLFTALLGFTLGVQPLMAQQQQRSDLSLQLRNEIQHARVNAERAQVRLGQIQENLEVLERQLERALERRDNGVTVAVFFSLSAAVSLLGQIRWLANNQLDFANRAVRTTIIMDVLGALGVAGSWGYVAFRGQEIDELHQNIAAIRELSEELIESNRADQIRLCELEGTQTCVVDSLPGLEEHGPDAQDESNGMREAAKDGGIWFLIDQLINNL